MCEPTTLAVIGATTAALQTAQQVQQANANRKTIRLNTERQQEEIDAQATNQIAARRLASQREVAGITAAAGEASVAGPSVALALLDALGRRSSDEAIIEQQRRFGSRASNQRSAQNLNQNQGPSTLNSGLRIATSFFNARNTGRNV